MPGVPRSVADNLFVGVDIGGTKVAAGLVNANGDILSQTRIAMVANGSAADGLNAILSAISKTLPSDSRSVHGIGICAPGPLDPRRGLVISAPNLPGWRRIPLAKMVSGKFGLPAKVENDANAAGNSCALRTRVGSSIAKPRIKPASASGFCHWRR